MIHKMIKDLKLREEINGIYLLRCALVKIAKNGKPYLLLSLADCSGEIGGILWNTDKIPANAGAPVLLSGKVGKFNGNLQIEVSRISEAPNDDIIPELLFRTSPVSPEIMLSKIRTVIASMKDRDYYAICEGLIQQNKEKLLTAPAAIRSHHACIGGLLMHIAGMLSCADYVAQQYSDAVDRDLLLAGIVLHDIGKLRAYAFSEWGVAFEYSQEGSKIGHAALSSEMLDEAIEELHIPKEKILPLKGLILLHHSDPGYRTVPQQSLEATILHQLDMIDSSVAFARERPTNMRAVGSAA